MGFNRSYSGEKQAKTRLGGLQFQVMDRSCAEVEVSRDDEYEGTRECTGYILNR